MCLIFTYRKLTTSQGAGLFLNIYKSNLSNCPKIENETTSGAKGRSQGKIQKLGGKEKGSLTYHAIGGKFQEKNELSGDLAFALGR